MTTAGHARPALQPAFLSRSPAVNERRLGPESAPPAQPLEPAFLSRSPAVNERRFGETAGRGVVTA